LTNERKKMSKTTLRKRIALTATTALFAGMLSVATAPVSQSAVPHVAVGGSNDNAALGAQSGNTSLYVATAANTGGAAVVATVANTTLANISALARSTGLLNKDTSTGTAQTATMLAGSTLSLYAAVTTTVAFTVSAGTIGSTSTMTASTATFADPAKTVLFSVAGNADITATGAAVLWTAPTTVGTYTVAMYYASNTNVPTLVSPGSGTLGAQITVTVVAASAGGTFSAPYSLCLTKLTSAQAASTDADATDSFVVNGDQWYIAFVLRDVYSQPLSAAGSLVATATNGGIINMTSTGGASALTAGTASTVVAAGSGVNGQVRVDQPTSGVPLTTTVTITYNGTTVCTKTVSIAGAAASITISDVATVDLSGNAALPGWLSDTYTSGAASGRDGHYYVTLKDSAGNIVKPASSAEFSMDPATTTTTVTALAVNSSVATATSSTNPFSKSVGTFTCGPAAGSSNVKLRHTSASTGVTISSPAFAARCADDPYTYTASWDKASYVQGEIATLTVKFLDSKGNAANSLDTPGAATMVTPMMTAVTATGSATMLPKADGTKTYTFTVGLPGGITAGTYTSIIDFTGLTGVAATVQTPTYKVGLATTDVAFSEILKSVVALIASINKQIQALQKLILKR
jgi:hypothetical protein